jgi:hypothetical protein
LAAWRRSAAACVDDACPCALTHSSTDPLLARGPIVLMSSCPHQSSFRDHFLTFFLRSSVISSSICSSSYGRHINVSISESALPSSLMSADSWLLDSLSHR